VEQKNVNDNSEMEIKGNEARRQIVAAGLAEICRRKRLVRKLRHLDGSVLIAALRTFGSPRGAVEWLICPAYGLGGAVPAEVAATVDGRIRVIRVLGCIEYNVPL
jgi:uncharacterized protein (DUF2384 family)